MGEEVLLSIVIPVYNAEEFISSALDSALQFKEVDEVVFVDDGSKDKSLSVLQNIASGNPKVKVYQHPKGQNLGAGPSRSLGVKMAKGKWIAFLDVDDLFLPNRFDKERETIFKEDNLEIDGIYGAIGSHNIDDAEASEFNLDITTVSDQVPPDQLKYTLLQVHRAYTGYFHLIALTVRASLIERVGYFASNLPLKQDTDFCIKLSLLGNLHAGIISEPIGSRGIHRNNRISKMSFSEHLEFKEIMLNNLLNWIEEKGVSDELAIHHIKNELDTLAFVNKQKPLSVFKMLKFFKKRPDIFYDNKKSEVLIQAVFGRNSLGRLITKVKEKTLLTFSKSNVQKWNRYVS